MSNCQYCNTPLHLKHQQEAHTEQPCRGFLLAEIARLKEENAQLKKVTKAKLGYRVSSYTDMYGSPGDAEFPFEGFQIEMSPTPEEHLQSVVAKIQGFSERMSSPKNA